MRNGRIMAVAAALQTAKGTPATVDPATHAMVATGIDPKPYQGDNVSSNVVKSHMGSVVSMRVGEHNLISFQVELNGSGTAGTAPAYGSLLQACGYNETVAVDNVLYDFVATDAINSTKFATIVCWLDGEKHTIEDARGKVTFSVNEKQLPVATFDFIGKYTKPVHLAAMPTFDYSAFVDAIPVSATNTPVFQLIDGVTAHDLVGSSFSVDDGLGQTHRNRPNYEGHAYTGDRNGSGSMQFDAPGIDTFDLYAKWESHQAINTLAAKVQHGTVAGQILELNVAKLQITDLTRSETDGVMQYNTNFNMLPINGDDEFTLTVK